MIIAAFVVLACAAACFFVRFVIGPSLSDRIVAIDGMLVVGVSAIGVEAVRTGVDPRARRPARRGRPSRGRGVPSGTGNIPNDDVCWAAFARGRDGTRPCPVAASCGRLVVEQGIGPV